MNILTQTKDTHKNKVNVYNLNQLASLYNRDGEEKDQNHDDRQAEERKKNSTHTQNATAPQQQ